MSLQLNTANGSVTLAGEDGSGPVTVNIPRAGVYSKSEIDSGAVVLNAVKAVDGAGSGLDADTVDGVQGALLGIGGAGYAWVNETANRAAGVTYTNTTGKPIEIAISWINIATAGGVGMNIIIDGLIFTCVVPGASLAANNAANVNSMVIPSGSTYRVDLITSSINRWYELK